MSDEKVLTKEIAEQFVADEDSVDLSEFTAIEDDAAEVLGAYCGNHDLALYCVSEFSHRQIEHLAKHRGKGELQLGVRNVSDETAEALSKHIGLLNLESAERLSLSASQTLMSHDGQIAFNCPEIEGIEELKEGRLPSESLIQILARTQLWLGHKWEDWNEAPRLMSLNRDDAKTLAHNFPTDMPLCLSGWVDDFPDGSIAELASFEGALELTFTNLTNENAWILTQFKSTKLHLVDTEISSEVAKILLSFPNELAVNVKELPEDVREILFEHASMQDRGFVSEPEITATCYFCGEKRTFVLEPEWERADGEAYEMQSNCLERNDWQQDPVLCDRCKDADSDEDEDDRDDED